MEDVVKSRRVGRKVIESVVVEVRVRRQVRVRVSGLGKRSGSGTERKDSLKVTACVRCLLRVRNGSEIREECGNLKGYGRLANFLPVEKYCISILKVAMGYALNWLRRKTKGYWYNYEVLTNMVS